MGAEVILRSAMINPFLILIVNTEPSLVLTAGDYHTSFTLFVHIGNQWILPILVVLNEWILYRSKLRLTYLRYLHYHVFCFFIHSSSKMECNHEFSDIKKWIDYKDKGEKEVLKTLREIIKTAYSCSSPTAVPIKIKKFRKSLGNILPQPF